MAPGHASDELEPGQSLGRYEVLRKLATGGMAEIYLARVRGEAGFEKLVVLKRILPRLATDRAFVRMFLDEARLAATLRHPNIGDVFDVGEEDGTYFFAMEYVAGQDARMLRVEAKRLHRAIPLGISLAIVSATAAALAHAHDRRGPKGPLGLVHRDVSPSNILVSYDGAIKLVDFGIARAEHRATRTETGRLKGKIPYMSPEQCCGIELDHRSDLFSLGTVLYELTTGVRPFRGRTDFEIMEAIVNGTPAPPMATVPDYPRELEKIVMRLLEREPALRYQAAERLVENLEQLMVSHAQFGSALVIGKFMRELFAERPGGWDRADTALRPREAIVEQPTNTPVGGARPVVGRQATREYPQGQPPAALIAALEPPGDSSWDEPTAGFQRRDAALRTPLHTPVTAPRVVEQAASFDDVPTKRAERAELAAAFAATADKTAADAVLPFDPVAARSAEILAEVDVGAPSAETRARRAARRIPALFDQGWAWYELGELDKAVIALELALSEDPTGIASQKLIHRNRETIQTVFEAFLGDPRQRPMLARPLDELANVSFGARAGFLLSRVDGNLAMAELIDVSGMPRLEACRQLCQLVLRGALVVG